MNYLQTLTNMEAFQSFRKTSLAFTGGICTLGGLVADVLQPIAPIISYVFFLALVALIVIAILYFTGKKNLIGALILTIVGTVGTGLIALLQTGEEAEEVGFIASVAPPVAELQASLGLIEKKIDSIKEDTQKIKSATERIETRSTEMASSIEDIKSSLENVSGDGVIANPSYPEDHYHNARIHELGGDYPAARRSYLGYFAKDLGKLDPHLRFISFLKIQEGSSGARETYNEIAYRHPSEVSDYIKRLLLNTESRKEKLLAYHLEQPDFAPAAYHLSLEFSERRLGSQTLSEKRKELKYLQAFVEADQSGGLVKHFVDQELVAEWRDDAATRLASLKSGSDATALSNPVSINWMAHNGGWNGNIQVLEPTRELKWNIKGQTAPRSTGDGGFTDPRTGKPAPRQFFTLPRNQQDTIVEIRYVDSAGEEHGPYEFEFKAKTESVDGNRRILELAKG